FISFFICIGFIHAASLKSITYSLLQTLQNYMLVPLTLVEGIKNTEEKYSQIKTVFVFLKRTIIPLLTTAVFYFIYREANVVFAQFSDIVWDKIFIWIWNIFDFSFTQVLFLILGIFIITGALFKQTILNFIRPESNLHDNLSRHKNPITLRNRINKAGFFNQNFTLGLKSEYRTAVYFLILVNSLLLLVNTIDIIWVWFGFEYSVHFNYKQSVHEGTYLLIFSILLSTAILLYYFRGNLNFYKNNELLKQLAYIWIVQNMVLTFSVGVRTWHYISFQGLAYKRLGVLVFLVLTLIGLITLFIKIRQKKSAFYLWRTNTWATYIVLIIFCMVHWDMLIVKYNLTQKNVSGIADFYLVVSNHTLPILYENIEIIEQQINIPPQNRNRYLHISNFNNFKHNLDQKRDQYLAKHKAENWPSWNYEDAKTKAYFKQIP
ncbi:MAG: DUF4153 domain-containing protein, partial [Bacteroidia bacterium]